MTVPESELTVESLLEALRTAGRAPSLDLIRRCLERQEELTPGLLEMLATNPRQAYGIEGKEDPRLLAPVHAGNLLIAYAEPRAIPIFVEIFRDEERANLYEWFVGVLHPFGEQLIEPFANIIRDTGVSDYGRAVATEALVRTGRRHPELRQSIIAALIPALPDDEEVAAAQDADDDQIPDIWSWVAVALADLSAQEALPQVRELSERGLLLEEFIGDTKELERRFAKEPEPVRPFNILDTYRYLQVQEQQRAAQQAEQERAARASSEHERVEPGGPTVRSVPKVGRNDPCPCGSGRKYKHCHGRPGGPVDGNQ
jgi:hypothetical protein